MPAFLALYEDILSDAAALALPALPRMIFVVHGAATIADRALSGGEAWHGEGAVTALAGKDGATMWRWELAPEAANGAAAIGAGIASREKLAARLDTLPPGELLMRGDTRSGR